MLNLGRNGISLGVMASHGGTNLQSIIDACENDRIYGSVSVVISNNSRSQSIERARKSGISAIHLSSHTHPEPCELQRAIRQVMKKHDVDLVVLAGYMRKVGLTVLDAFPNRVINSHPALLPKHGGKGMYGDYVHSAVLNAGDKESGITIHLVDREYDQGPTVSQVKIPVLSKDTVDSLRSRVQQREHSFWVETIERIRTGDIDLDETAKDFRRIGNSQ